jgi:hypothetical protein
VARQHSLDCLGGASEERYVHVCTQLQYVGTHCVMAARTGINGPTQQQFYPQCLQALTQAQCLVSVSHQTLTTYLTTGGGAAFRIRYALHADCMVTAAHWGRRLSYKTKQPVASVNEGALQHNLSVEVGRLLAALLVMLGQCSRSAAYQV